jgi:hypothetical protein
MARNKKHQMKFQREVQILKELHKEFGIGKGIAPGFP